MKPQTKIIAISKVIGKIIATSICIVLLLGIYISLRNLQIKQNNLEKAQKDLAENITNIYNKSSEQVSYLAKYDYDKLSDQVAKLQNFTVQPYYIYCPGGNCGLMRFDYSQKKGIELMPNIVEELRKFEGVAVSVGNTLPTLIGIIEEKEVIIQLGYMYHDFSQSKTVLYVINLDSKEINKLRETRKN